MQPELRNGDSTVLERTIAWPPSTGTISGVKHSDTADDKKKKLKKALLRWSHLSLFGPLCLMLGMVLLLLGIASQFNPRLTCMLVCMLSCSGCRHPDRWGGFLQRVKQSDRAAVTARIGEVAQRLVAEKTQYS